MMKQSLPLVEQWWRKWRDTGNNLQALRYAIQQKQSFFETIGRTDPIPAQVIEPGALFYNLFNPSEAIRQNLQTSSDNLNPLFWSQLHVASAYRTEKTYWRVDADLWESLQETQWPARTPTLALLHLPNRFAVLDLPHHPPVIVLYDLATSKESGKEEDIELRILQMFEDEVDIVQSRFLPLGILSLTSGTLDEAVDRMMLTILENHQKAGQQGLSEQEQSALNPRPFLSAIVNLLLFAAGNDDIQPQPSGQWPTLSNKILRRRKDDRLWLKDIREGEVSDVGVRFGSVIRGYRQTHQHNSEEGEGGRTVRPHIRAAHPHLFWTGVGRTVPRVRFLPPMPIKGASLLEEAPQRTQRIVKKG